MIQKANTSCAVFLIVLVSIGSLKAKDQNDSYLNYHTKAIEAEESITRGEYGQALGIYEQLFQDYKFVFLRDLKVATQIALHTEKTDQAFRFLKRGIANGWEMKAIRKNKFLNKLHDYPQWTTLKNEYGSLRSQYRHNLDQGVREEVYRMFKKDQGKALGALLVFGPKNRDRYAERKFAPHSQNQLAHFEKIMGRKGYPGERLIGNSFWMETILSHHNSMTVALTRQDTVYPRLRPHLLRAVELGQMSPYEFAIIDNWYIAIKSDSRESSYGNLEGVLGTGAELNRANAMRKSIGLRSVEIRNKLIDVQQKTGMNFYLPSRPAPNARIEIKSI